MGSFEIFQTGTFETVGKILPHQVWDFKETAYICVYSMYIYKNLDAAVRQEPSSFSGG